LAISYFPLSDIGVIGNSNDSGKDGWQRSFLKYAKNKNVKVLSLDDVYGVDNLIFISLEFDKIVNPENFKSSRLYNIHFSLLPKYKGMYTSVWPILNGDEFTGVTLHQIDRGIDTGDIIDQLTIKLSPSDRSFDCYTKYIEAAKDLLSKNFVDLINGELKSFPQPSFRSSYFSKGSIDFSKISIDFNKSAWEVQRQVYAFSFRPYQLVKFGGRIISDVVILDERSTSKPGSIIEEEKFYVKVSTIDYDVNLIFEGLEFFLNKIELSSIEEIKSCFLRAVGVNDKNNVGWSPIIVAAYYGRRDVVEWLLESGANINDRNYKGTTVLMYAKDYALKSKDSGFFQFVLSKGADIDALDYSGKSLFDYVSDADIELLGIKK